MKSLFQWIQRHGRLTVSGALLLLVLGSVSMLPAATVAQSPAVPLQTPDATVGLPLYADRCANCHGPLGNGDGEMSGRLPAPPRQFTDPAYYRQAVPAVIYDVISNGRLDQGMPPFGPASSNPIPEANRWDAIAAVYSLAIPAETMAQGETIYAENCTACHGDTGLGDGPDAEDVTTDLSSPIYWYDKSNEMVFTALAPGTVAAHDYELSEDDQWAVVAYARSLSFVYVNPNAPLPAIEAGTISGVVTNGTTPGDLSGQDVVLRAFTSNFEETLTLTTTVGTDNTFVFDVTEVQPDWIFLVSVAYEGLNFSSAAAQLSPGEPVLDLPVTVYDQTTDGSVISIQQVHTILGFSGDFLDVASLYVVNNEDTAVFMGESGNPEDGTVRFFVPEGAEGITFERAFNDATNFLPATEVIATADGYADTLPLRPGIGALNLLVSYRLPFTDGMTVSYDLPYRANGASVIMPDAGVLLDGEGWSSQGIAQTPSGNFARYSNTTVQGSGRVNFSLSGTPQLVTAPGGSAITPRNQNNELIVGGLALLLVVIGGVFALRSWQNRAAVQDEWDEAEEEDEETWTAVDERNYLLQAIADLDEAYDAGSLSEADYQQQRDALKAELMAVWDEANS